MNSKKIKELVVASYKNGKLDEKVVSKIASLMSNKDLKKYISELKISEKKKNLIISCPTDCIDIRNFQQLFPEKRIIVKKDPSLILGTRIEDNDNVYEFTLKGSLDKIVEYVEQNYD